MDIPPPGMNVTRIAFDELPTLAGRRFEGRPFRVSREERDTFEDVTWVDRAYDQPDPPEFPLDIVEGFHSLALLDAVVAFVQPVDAATAYAYNYGLDRVRFTAPITIGELILPSFEVVDVRRRGGGWLVLRRCTLTVAGSDRPALVADWWVLYLPTGESESSSVAGA